MRSKIALLTSAAVLLIAAVLLCCKFFIKPPLPEILVWLERFTYDSETSGRITCTVSNISRNQDAVAEFDTNSVIMITVDTEARLYQVEAVTLKPGESFTAELFIDRLNQGAGDQSITVTAKTKSGVVTSSSRPITELALADASTKLWSSLERVDQDEGRQKNNFLWTLENWSDVAWRFAENRIMQIHIDGVPLDYPTEAVTLMTGQTFSKVFRVEKPYVLGESVMTVTSTTEDGTKIVLETILR